MSPLYESKVRELKAWYVEKLPALGEIRMSRADYGYGTDRVPKSHEELVMQAFKLFLDGGYELSYNQQCVAFFGAARKLGLLILG